MFFVRTDLHIVERKKGFDQNQKYSRLRQPLQKFSSSSKQSQFMKVGSKLYYYCKNSHELGFPRDVPGQTGTGRPVVPLSRDKKKFLSRCPFVPGQGQEQMSRDKLLCPVPSRDNITFPKEQKTGNGRSKTGKRCSKTGKRRSKTGKGCSKTKK